MRHGPWALALVVGVAQAAPLRSTLDDQRAPTVTVYNGDLALVKDTRQVELPAGQSVLEVRDVSAQMRPETAGEERIDHTPENETALIKLGDVFDVTVHKKQTDFKALAVGKDDRPQFESAYRIELKNAKKTPVTVSVLEPIPGDWRVLESTLPQDKADANTALWRVTMPAGGGQTLAYRVRVRF